MKTLIATLLACSALAPATFAQNVTQERAPAERRDAPAVEQGRERYAGENLDQQIAACLLLGNQEEIALAKLGEQRAQNPQVKEFARMLAEQHAKALAKIQKAAPEVANLKLAAATAGQPPTAAATAGSDRGLALLQQVKAECLKLTRQELEQHQGADFDKAFVGQQLGAHLAMLAQLRGSKSFASPELQKVIAEGDAMTVAHLEEAKKIKDQIKGKPSQTAAAAGQRTAVPKR